jgi:CRP-like cAMP-binding protein
MINIRIIQKLTELLDLISTKFKIFFMSELYSNCNSCQSKDMNIFSCLNEHQLNNVSESKETKTHKKGSYLFKIGEEATYYYCIQNGQVRTFKSNGLGREQTFLIKTVGDWVGCRDVILSNQYNYSAICLTDVTACAIPKSQLEHLSDDPFFKNELLKEMAKNWRESEDKIFSLGTKQIHSKLAEFLLLYYKSNDCKEEITLSFTREVIASIIGTTTESVIRALSDFKVRDWIELDKNKIIFKNIQALASISEIEKSQISY